MRWGSKSSKRSNANSTGDSVNPYAGFKPDHPVHPSHESKQQYIADSKDWSQLPEGPDLEAYSRFKHHEAKFNERQNTYLARGNVDHRTKNNLFNRVEHSNRAQWHAAEQYNKSYYGAEVPISTRNEITGRMANYVSDSRLPAETIRDVRDYTDYPRPISNLPAQAYKPLFERDSTRH
ncbi:uncharacterized protein FPRO_08202 [Fusarium proliferatum ET1]|uniref:Uncharacterized protein n=2 Tax=Gibberella intermedia TaxID=948311 RepID=A0A1L7W2F8_FUSPR|nr:uncharacterized protein FPRO_08202 [Fusarium proliferatum ET1]CZR46828.1 uncharacterized protein FPRO_08202 [Fusarium proliferatum ET1]